jgi:hypothetical protein
MASKLASASVPVFVCGATALLSAVFVGEPAAQHAAAVSRDNAAIVLDLPGDSREARERLNALALQGHPQYSFVLRTQDYDGLRAMLASTGWTATLTDRSTEYRLETFETATTESVEQWLKLKGLKGFRRKAVPGKLEVHVPEGFEEIYAARLDPRGLGASRRGDPCKTCMGTALSYGPSRRSGMGTAGLTWPRSGTRILTSTVKAIVEERFRSRGKVIDMTPRTEGVLDGQTGPVRDEILTGQDMCELIHIGINVLNEQERLGVFVAADAGFRPRGDDAACPAARGQYQTRGTSYQAEEERYAQQLANHILDRLFAN